MVDAYICGCSFSTGYYRASKQENPVLGAYNTPYPELYCIKNNLTFKNISLNGASNYAIAKQVQYAITQKPKLILVNLTTTHRFDFTYPDNRLENRPTIADVVYRDLGHNPVAPDKKQSIMSMPFHTVLRVLDDRVFNEFVVTYTDPYLLADYDRLILAGMFAELEKSQIPNIVVNFSPDFEVGSPDNVHHFIYPKMIKGFPVDTDPNHFNSDGHKVLANAIDPMPKKNDN